MTTEWVNDHAELVALADALVADDYFTNPEEMIEYIRKPWKWTLLREQWLAAGRPTDYDWDEAEELIAQDPDRG